MALLRSTLPTSICNRCSVSHFVCRIQSSSRVTSKTKQPLTMSNLERDRLGQPGAGDALCHGLLRGIDHIKNPQLNKVRPYCFIFIILQLLIHPRQSIISSLNLYINFVGISYIAIIFSINKYILS